MAEVLKFPTVPEAKAFLGAPYTGKTRSLFLEIDNLLRDGVDSSEMLVFCSTPDAAQNFRARLKALCPQANAVRITAPRAFFLDLLTTEEAYAVTGRKARPLLPFENDFLLEDLKTSGIRPKRLREILKFFYRSLTELADDEDEDWLLTSEEVMLFGLLRDSLGFMGAILEPEFANLAVRYLMSSKEALGKAAVSHVFVDDFQLLSRASQIASCLLAKRCIYLAADEDATTEVYESYPYLDGVEEFIQANPQTTLTRFSMSHSCFSAAKACRALRQENGIDVSAFECSKAKDTASLSLIERENPLDEIAGVTDVVQQCLNSGLDAKDIVIAAPHNVWMQSILRQLKARGIPAEILPDPRFLKSDIRDNEKCFNARFLTVLNLVADPTDAVAWRCWCGFGDYLGNSNGMLSLRDFGKAQGKTLDAVLGTDVSQQDILNGLDVVASGKRILKAHGEMLALIDRLSTLSGRDLLEAIAHELAEPDVWVPKEIERLLSCEDEMEDKGAASMANRIRTNLEFPVYSRNDVVRVASYKNVAGMDPQYLFLPGFMNGFFPKKDYFDGTVLTIEQREKRYTKDLSCIASVVAKASDTLVVSYCKKLNYEDAMRFDLVIYRINFENNKRVAKTEPSIFLKFIGD